MKLTIVVEDRVVGVNGVFRSVNLPDMGTIRAVQWDGSKGHVEYVDGAPNTVLENIDGFAEIIELWEALTPPEPTEPEVTPPTLAEVKLQKTEEIKYERDRLTLQGGHKIGNYWYHSNEISLIQQLALNGVANQMLAGGATDATVIVATPWKTMSGDFVTLTVGIAKNFVQSALTQQSALFAAAQNKITEVNALNTVEAVQEYDVQTGFPAVFQA